jgi:hypothetical protein
MTIVERHTFSSSTTTTAQQQQHNSSTTTVKQQRNRPTNHDWRKTRMDDMIVEILSDVRGAAQNAL